MGQRIGFLASEVWKSTLSWNVRSHAKGNNSWVSRLQLFKHCKRGSTLGQGAIALKPRPGRLAPKYFGYRLTAVKLISYVTFIVQRTQSISIGAKSVVWPSKYTKMRFRPGLRLPPGELTTLHRPHSRLGSSLPHPTRRFRHLDFPVFGARHSAPSAPRFERVLPPYFPLEPRLKHCPTYSQAVRCEFLPCDCM